MSKQEQMEAIHNSLICGQKKQMVEQIGEYMLYDFWEDYLYYLKAKYNPSLCLKHYSDTAIAYFRITNR